MKRRGFLVLVPVSLAARPLVAEALWRETLIDAAVFREWIVNVGRRPAANRTAHLIAEVGKRLEAVTFLPAK